MADLSDTNSAQAVKLVGADSTGAEQTPIKSTANGELLTGDSITTNTINGVISVSTALEAKVSASRLTNRKGLWITPTDKTIYWGSSSGVTANNGTPIFKNQTIFIAVANVAIWLISSSGTADVRIVEAS